MKNKWIKAYLITLAITIIFVFVVFALMILMIYSDRFRIGFYQMYGKDGFIADAEFIKNRLIFVPVWLAMSPLASILITPLIYLQVESDDKFLNKQKEDI